MVTQENSAFAWVSPRGGQQPRPIQNRSERRRTSRSSATGNNKVLLFGQQRELALYRAEVLRHNGFTVITPPDEADAVAAIQRGGFGAVILSYTLPTDTVEQLAELVKQKCPDSALVAISQTGRVDRRIDPDEIVVANEGPAALLEALDRVMRPRLQ